MCRQAIIEVLLALLPTIEAVHAKMSKDSLAALMASYPGTAPLSCSTWRLGRSHNVSLLALIEKSIHVQAEYHGRGAGSATNG